MSAPTETSPSDVAKWLAGIIVTSVLSALAALGGNAMSHEHRLSALETRVEDYRQQLERIERKLDRALELRK